MSDVTLLKILKYHTVRFYLKNRVAFLTVWHNGIIEEQITDEEGKEIYFYLHYTLKSLSQFLSLL